MLHPLAVLAAGSLLVAAVSSQSKWTVQATAPLLLGVDAVDSLNCWVGGGSNGLGAQIWRTADGGRNWTRQYSGLDFAGMVLDIDMADRQVGWAGGMALPGMSGLAMTSDGGATWTPVQPVLRAFLFSAWQDVFALDRDNVWVVGTWVGLGAGDGIAASSDGGKTWAFTDTSTQVGTSARYVSFIDPDNGWLASGQFPSSNTPTTPYLGIVSKTTDGGVTWTNQLRVDGFYFSGIDFVDATHGWVVADGNGLVGQIYHTSDGGQSWSLQATTNGVSLNGIDMVDRNDGWAVGFGAGPAGNPAVGLFSTSDGGQTWHQDPFNAPYGPIVISMANKGRGWTVGSNNFQQGGIMMLDAEELGSYGASTPGCMGAITLSGNSRPMLGSRGFALQATPTSGAGVALLGAAPTSQRLLGLELLVSPVGMVAVPMGATLPLPLPNDPKLLGVQVYAQSVYPSACAAAGLAASQGLIVTLRQ